MATACNRLKTGFNDIKAKLNTRNMEIEYLFIIIIILSNRQDLEGKKAIITKFLQTPSKHPRAVSERYKNSRDSYSFGAYIYRRYKFERLRHVLMVKNATLEATISFNRHGSAHNCARSPSILVYISFVQSTAA